MKITVLILTLTVTTIAGAEIPEDVISEIHQRVLHKHNPSIAIGVFEQGKSTHYVHGWQNKAKNLAATSRTVYEIGSISKTFTGLLLARLVNTGKVQLDDPVQDIWPTPFALEDSNNQAITLKHLSTHTSGLPRIPPNLSAFSKDPYADYDRNKLLTAVNQIKINQSGSNYLYSNFAVGLLGETLAELEQATFNELISSKILQPLQLQQTYMQLQQVPETLLAQGYNGNTVASAWQFQALAGAGSIRSSIEDLLAYGAAHLNSASHDLKQAMQLATNSHYQQGHTTVGLGWHINKDGIIWHNGGTAGFSSIIMIDPAKQKVVAGITNTSPERNIEDMVAHLLDPSSQMIDHQFPLPIDANQLAQYTGQFHHQPSAKTINFTIKDDRLIMSATKQPRQIMSYIGNDTFKLNLFKVKVTFKRDPEDHINALKLHGWGAVQTYTKIPQ